MTAPTAATTPSAPTTAPSAPPDPSLATLLRAELADELRAVVREPTTLLFSVLMPVGFFALFVGLFGGGDAAGGGPAGTAMLGTYGAFGVLVVSAMAPGIGLAEDRQRGWLRVKRVWAVPLPVTLAAKVLASLPYSLAVLAAMTAVSAAYGHLDLRPVSWLVLVVTLVGGSLPFALLGLTVGALAGPNPTAAILNAVVMPAAVVGGLWFPLDLLPSAVQRAAPFVPTYHLGQLGLAAVGDGSRSDHVLALLAWSAVAALAAGLAYRRARP